MVAATQANVSRKVLLPLPGVGASSRRRKSRRAEGLIGRPGAKLPLTVATAEAPMRKESSGLSTLMRIGKRAASRIQSSERSTRGSPLTLVPFSGNTAQPSPTTVPRKCLLGCDCKYNIHRRAGRDVP